VTITIAADSYQAGYEYRKPRFDHPLPERRLPGASGTDVPASAAPRLDLVANFGPLFGWDGGLVVLGIVGIVVTSWSKRLQRRCRGSVVTPYQSVRVRCCFCCWYCSAAELRPALGSTARGADSADKRYRPKNLFNARP
jgi:hypothetical protein